MATQEEQEAAVMAAGDDVAFVPVEQEPLHRQRWKNDFARLVCVQIPTHTTCLWHQHLNFGVSICVQDLDARERPRGAEPRALAQSKGAVFCRDHAEDQLIHVVWTHDTPLFIIEVELLKEKRLLAPHDDLPQHVARGVLSLHDAPECRVYRIELLTKHTEEVALELPTSAVLVAVDECVVTIFNPAAAAEMLANEVHLQPGDDVVLVPGLFEIKLVARDHPESVALVLTEVF
ncbi:hypothetical protein PybrP1_011036 [[Pythium] brassicae (nom. inval.)]|nr:hypothetical protein PybrP1_011036 [[Pythium] brassicae (nom. inval.)]